MSRCAALRRSLRGQAAMAAGRPIAAESGTPPAIALPTHRMSGTTAFALAGEHRPGAPEAGVDLVEDHHAAELVAQRANAAQEAVGRDDDAAAALDRLEHDRADLRGRRSSAARASASARSSDSPGPGNGKNVARVVDQRAQTVRESARSRRPAARRARARDRRLRRRARAAGRSRAARSSARIRSRRRRCEPR